MQCVGEDTQKEPDLIAANEARLPARRHGRLIYQRNPGLIYHHSPGQPKTEPPSALKPRKTDTFKLHRGSAIKGSTSLLAAMDQLQMEHAQQQLRHLQEGCQAPVPVNHTGLGSAGSHKRLRDQESCTPWGSPQQPATHSKAARLCSGNGHAVPNSKAAVQQQAGRTCSSFTSSSSGKPLPQQPAALSLMASTSKALLRLAAEHASPAAAIRLKQQLLQQLRLAAAIAEEVGQHFEVAAAVEQLLPGLQEAVLRECKEAQQQRNTVAAAAAAAAAAALKASEQQQSHLRHYQSIAAAVAAGAASAAAADKGVLRSVKAARSSGGGQSASDHAGSSAATPQAEAEASAVHSEAHMPSPREWHDEQGTESVHQQQQQQQAQLQPQIGDSSGSESNCDGWHPQQTACDAMRTPAAAASAGAAAATDGAAAADGADAAPDAPQQLELLLRAIDMLPQ